MTDTDREETELMRSDAARYRWLRDNYIGASFDFDGEGLCVLAFEIPGDSTVSGDCDNTIDRAMLAERAKQ